jgi:hypothetical protein
MGPVAGPKRVVNGLEGLAEVPIVPGFVFQNSITGPPSKVSSLGMLNPGLDILVPSYLERKKEAG